MEESRHQSLPTYRENFPGKRPQATLAAPYSLRLKPDATVSMPLHWDEVTTGLKMKDFTIYNTMERMPKQGDIFRGVPGKGINLKKKFLKNIEIAFGNQEMLASLQL